MLKSIFNRTLNSVPFGISIMVLIGIYIAIGSGFSDVRAYFEMTDMQFFNAWPLKTLMVLLVLNLSVVTWTHIPFTPPRYGVWMIHTGIIVLIFGMAVYYATKKEGMVMINRGGTVAHFYDGEERALFLRPSIAGGGPMPSVMMPLENLPRFGLYLAEDPAGAHALNRPGLQNIEPPALLMRRPSDGEPHQVALVDALQLPQPLTVDIVGYYPYGQISTQWRSVPGAAGAEGIQLALTAEHLQSTAQLMLVASDPRSAQRPIGQAELEHRQLSDASSVKLMELAARQMHRLKVQLPGYDKTFYAMPGEQHPLGDTGYTLKIEDFSPEFPAMNGETVSLITMHVTTPTQQFRRQVIMGRERPTDWKLDDPQAGPMGKRQTTPLDDTLKVEYTFSDPMHLAPHEGRLKHNFITAEGKGIDVVVGIDRPVEVSPMQGDWKFELSMDGHPIGVVATVLTGLQREDGVREIPPEQRTRDTSQAGSLQVVLARVKMGDWSRTVAVPFLPYLWDHPDQWNGPIVELPGGKAAIQLQLGRTIWQLPATVTLTDFQLEHYPGGAVMSGMPRDFISTLEIKDRRTGEVMVDEARMNHPVYWPAGLTGKTWTFFQAQWDPQGQRWTVLGVGTRHGTWVMMLGCVMMSVGLMWAFYLKPIIQRRMKAKALAKFGKPTGGKRPARLVPAPQLQQVMAGSSEELVGTQDGTVRQ